MSPPSERLTTDPRLTRRRLAERRSRRRRAWTRAAAATAVALTAWAAFWSPLLEVRAVRVVGGRHTTSQEVARAAGLDLGDNLLLVSTSAIAERAATLPWVRDARVDRKLPGTVVVRVKERRPALVLATPRGSFTIDARGRVLARGRRLSGLPVLHESSGEDVTAGRPLRGEPARAALRAYRSLAPRFRRRVAAIFAPSLERISFQLRGGPAVRFGAAERLGAKDHVLRAVLGRLARQDRSVAYVDVRVPDAPAVGWTPTPAPTVTPTASPSPSSSPSPARTPHPRRTAHPKRTSSN